MEKESKKGKRFWHPNRRIGPLVPANTKASATYPITETPPEKYLCTIHGIYQATVSLISSRSKDLIKIRLII